jgi:4-amino-4-deoxy-L-arabinose transferase-like glycosyltransferase
VADPLWREEQWWWSEGEVQPAARRHGPSGRPAVPLRERLAAAPWPLLAIVAAQAVLSARLTVANTAFVDEAAYLTVGHLEISHLLYHTPVSGYQQFFSGSPVLYPVTGAIADSIGGLVAARLLSLAFMLGATCLLYGMTARLFGRGAAIGAAAVFAVLGPTQFMGAFATYDAMSLFLLALAAWCVVRAGGMEFPISVLVTAAAVMTAANAAKYASALFDPVIVALAILAAHSERGWRGGLKAGAWVAGSAIAAIAALLAWGGHSYLTGIETTTLARAAASDPAALVLRDSAWQVGAIAVLAAGGVVFLSSSRLPRGHALTGLLLGCAVLLAPAEQARIHTTTSLFKHTGYGAWFAAAVAGYALARLTALHRARWRAAVGAAAATAIMALVAVAGTVQATRQFTSWPNSSRLIAALRPVVHRGDGRYLMTDYYVAAYYLRDQSEIGQWRGTWDLAYRDPVTGRALTGAHAYTAAINNGAFSAVAVSFDSVRDAPPSDSAITYALRYGHTYRLVARLPSQTSQGVKTFREWLPRRSP